MRFLILLVLYCCCGLALAQDMVSEYGFFEDKSGKLTLSEVQVNEFTLFNGTLNKGFGPSAFWVRLKIEALPLPENKDTAQCTLDRQLIVRIQPSLLDEVLLFDPTINAEPQLADDHSSGGPRGFLLLNHGFSIAATPAPRTIWLRLSTTSLHAIKIAVIPMTAALRADRIHEILLSLLVGCMTFLLIWGGVMWAVHREHLLLLFSASKLVTLMYTLAVLGFLRIALADWLSPLILDKLANLLLISASVTAVLFHIHFLREFKPSQAGLRALYVMVWLFPFQLLLFALHETSLAMQLTNWYMLLGPLGFLLVAATSKAWELDQPDRVPYISKSVLIGFYFVLAVSLWVVALAGMSATPAVDWLLYGYPMIGALNGALMLILLLRRAQHMEKMHLMTAMRLDLAQQQIDQEQRQLQQQSSFISMLTHELKTPLAVIRLALGTLNASPAQKRRANLAINDMSAVIDRCVQMGKLEERGNSIQRTEVDLEDLLRQLCESTGLPDRFQINFESTHAKIATDPELLRIVLSNLVDNAVKYSEPDSPISIRTLNQSVNHAQGISIFVKNLEGPFGRPSSGSVFEKYYRNPNALGHTGSGLGLHLSAWLTLQLGGELRYNPKDHEVEFECRLPA